MHAPGIMNSKIAITALLLWSWDSGRSDLFLNTGDVFTYEFQTITFDYSVLSPWFLTLNVHFGYAVDGKTFDANSDVILVEAFETSTNEAPFFSGTVPSAAYEWTIESLPSHWLDLQGVLRITVVSGSVVLQTIQIGAVTRDTQGYNAYNSLIISTSLPWLEIGRSAEVVTISWSGQFTN